MAGDGWRESLLTNGLESFARAALRRAAADNARFVAGFERNAQAEAVTQRLNLAYGGQLSQPLQNALQEALNAHPQLAAADERSREMSWQALARGGASLVASAAQESGQPAPVPPANDAERDQLLTRFILDQIGQAAQQARQRALADDLRYYQASVLQSYAQEPPTTQQAATLDLLRQRSLADEPQLHTRLETAAYNAMNMSEDERAAVAQHWQTDYEKVKAEARVEAEKQEREETQSRGRVMAQQREIDFDLER